MSLRRLILAAGLGGLALAGVAAIRPWPVDPGWAAAIPAGPLAEAGLALDVAGEARISLLPLPRLSFARARLSAGEPGGAVLAEGGSLSIRINPLALLVGRVGLEAISLDGARIRLAGGSAPDPLLSRLGARIGSGGAGLPRRINLTRCRVDFGGDAIVDEVDLVLAWADWSRTAQARGGFVWRGRRMDLALAEASPGDLVAGGPSPVAVRLAWPGGTFAATGAASWAATPRVVGTARLDVASLPETLGWLDRDAPLLPIAGRLALDGDFEADAGMLVTRRLRVEVGGNVLDGAGSVAIDARRLAVRATLAAETINLAPLLGSLVRLFGPGGAGEAPPVAIAPLTGGDLDLRLSAATARIGPLAAQDVAASVIVKGDAIEVALARAGIRGGTVKGRAVLSAAADPAETEIRAQGAFDRVDLGGLLDQVGEGRWLSGPAQGHLTLETAGRDAAELAARVAGRASLAIDGGTLVGLDLADVIHRNGIPAPGALARRNGRTPFERAGLSLRFSEGIGEIGDGALKGAGLSANLRGRISLPERSMRVRGELVPKEGRPGAVHATAFEIAGPWDAVTVRTAPAPSPGGQASDPGP